MGSNDTYVRCINSKDCSDEGVNIVITDQVMSSNDTYVRCINSKDCSDEGVNIVITDQDFIMSKKALQKMAQSTNAQTSLLSQGIVDIEYRNKIDESNDYPYYLAFVIWYQQGQNDITVVQLYETKNFVCKLFDRSYGSVLSQSGIFMPCNYNT
uniref:Uncharacterized protein n=1 Tax=Lactuca sativa TaxID=4236 RepID=A0A9R1XW86_LACSA|nr:hypothetical protein LSAT_V11C100047550 [Lactuca sativa]